MNRVGKEVALALRELSCLHSSEVIAWNLLQRIHNHSTQLQLVQYLLHNDTTLPSSNPILYQSLRSKEFSLQVLTLTLTLSLSTFTMPLVAVHFYLLILFSPSNHLQYVHYPTYKILTRLPLDIQHKYSKLADFPALIVESLIMSEQMNELLLLFNDLPQLRVILASLHI